MSKGIPVDIHAAIEKLTFFGTRTPESHGAAPETFAARLADCRDGGVFVSHWAGRGEWERHPADEVVLVLEGTARAFLVQDGKEVEHSLSAGQLIVIPENSWHRFESANLKILTVTPRPTEHQVEFPG